MRDFNYVISRRMVSLPYDMIALESLKYTDDAKWTGQKIQEDARIIILSRTGKIHKIQGRGFRHIVVYVNPKHTSQRCS
ncbi:MAG: hypothetical protein ACP5T9_02735, partial [Thermoplasmata archaeon]